MKKLLIAAISLVGIMGTTQAQGYYKQAVGLRLNDGYAGLTYKYFTSTAKAVDLTLNIDFDSGIGLTGLIETHKATGFAPRLSWYYGYGAHGSLAGNDVSTSIGLGVDGVLGLEFAASEIPFAFSLDYIPSYSITMVSEPDNWPDNTDWDGTSGGFNFRNWTIGIKYTFIKSDLENKRKEALKKDSSPK
tara:strand:+ start:621 stop:1187 length:567 start_codon:yes stop_codon:yes gene_type:complete